MNHYVSRGFTHRIIALGIGVFLILALLVIRLWFEQLRLGSVHQRAISKQSIRRIRVPPIRGRIFSRDGKCLADNLPVYNAYFHIHELRQPGYRGRNKTLSFFYECLSRTAGEINRPLTIQQKEINRHSIVYPALPFKAFSALTDKELARLYEVFPAIPGLEISMRPKRHYPMRFIGSHIIGFVGRKDPNLEKERDFYSYFLPELTGRSGLERALEDNLKGQGGCDFVRVNSVGLFHEEIESSQPALSGYDVVLTIDSRAQSIAQELLYGKKGAMVLIDCNSGAVRAMVSSPTYDLENMTGKRYAYLAQDQRNYPLLNRASSGTYTPGSILKPIIGLAMINELSPNSEAFMYDCPGYYTIGKGKIRCSSRYGHGQLGIVKALKVSCNGFFIQAGLELGLERIQPYLLNAGLGKRPRLEIKAVTGLAPTREGKLKRIGHPWGAFDTALLSIGQGQIMLSPLQAALYTAAIANGGTLYDPFLIQEIRDHDGKTIKKTFPHKRHQFRTSKNALSTIQEGMYHVVQKRGATGSKAKTSVIELAGKTGTAEVRTRRGKKKDTWFICYGPFHSPEYALAILVENGISGGKTNAPLAKLFFERYLTEQKEKLSQVSQ